MIKKIAKIIGVIFAVIMLILLVGAIIQRIYCNYEKDKIADSYGQTVEVFGNNMRVEIGGDGEAVVVLLAGAAESSPVLLFRPLASYLSENYTVVTIEYFGYGLSESTDRERSVKNVSEELHEVLSKLGYDEYILMPHSYSGLTALYYANQYPNEVKALVGIDSTVPAQYDYFDFASANITQGKIFSFLNNTGLLRFVSKIDPSILIEDVSGYEYSYEDYKLFRTIYLNHYYTANMMEELKLSTENSNTVYNMLIPNTIPALFFLSNQNAKIFESIGAPDNAWYDIHDNIIGAKDVSQIIMLDGGHYLQCSHPSDISELFNHWYQEAVKTKSTDWK